MAGTAFPNNSELQSSLVRLDAIEAWAPHAYALETVPVFTVLLRRALLGLLRERRVIYIETTRVGIRGFRAKKWMGSLEELGKPEPAPKAFIGAKVVRFH